MIATKNINSFVAVLQRLVLWYMGDWIIGARLLEQCKYELYRNCLYWQVLFLCKFLSVKEIIIMDITKEIIENINEDNLKNMIKSSLVKNNI